MIASILKLLKIFPEVIVASKCGPLARIEKQAMSLKPNLLKSFSKIREAPVQGDHNYRSKTKLWHTAGPSEKIL